MQIQCSAKIKNVNIPPIHFQHLEFTCFQLTSNQEEQTKIALEILEAKN
jgi:hypothetical protein